MAVDVFSNIRELLSLCNKYYHVHNWHTILGEAKNLTYSIVLRRKRAVLDCNDVDEILLRENYLPMQEIHDLTKSHSLCLESGCAL